MLSDHSRSTVSGLGEGRLLASRGWVYLPNSMARRPCRQQSEDAGRALGRGQPGQAYTARPVQTMGGRRVAVSPSACSGTTPAALGSWAHDWPSINVSLRMARNHSGNNQAMTAPLPVAEGGAHRATCPGA